MSREAIELGIGALDFSIADGSQPITFVRTSQSAKVARDTLTAIAREVDDASGKGMCVQGAHNARQ